MLCSRHAHHHLGHRSWLRCYYWPQAVVGGPCDGCLSLQLQPATLAPTSSPLVVRECHQDARPGVHSVSSWLLQLTAVWHERRTTSTLPVSAERCRPPGHRRSSEWLHHTSVTAATLTASSSANGVQDHGARASVARRSCYRVPCGRFSSSVGRWSSPCDPVLFTCGSCICSKHTINLATEFLGRWSSTVEWPSNWTVPARTVRRFLQTISKILSIWRLQLLVTLLNW